MRRRLGPPPDATGEPPRAYNPDDWADPDDPVDAFLDEASLRRTRRWLDARGAWIAELRASGLTALEVQERAFGPAAGG